MKGYLIEKGVMNEMKAAEIRNEFKDKIESELKIGFDVKPVVADTEKELEDVYASQGREFKWPIRSIRVQGSSR